MRKAVVVVVVTVWASLVTVCVLLLLVWIGRPKEGISIQMRQCFLFLWLLWSESCIPT